jgi:diguanylate cyclase (GGDEF)-like protein/PAS domain S-box-containing protein
MAAVNPDGSETEPGRPTVSGDPRAASNAMPTLDVAERDQERTRRAVEILHGRVVAALGQGIVVQDANGQIVDANESAERILGLSLDQMAGRTSMDPGWRAIHEDGSDFPGDAHPAMVSLRTAAPVRDVVMGVRLPGRRPRWIIVNAEPIPESEGRPASVVTSFTDISELRHAQEVLAESAKGHRFLAEDATDVLFEGSNEGVFTWLSQSVTTLLGWKPEEMTGCAFVEFVHPDDRLRMKPLQESLRAGSPADFDVRLRTASEDYVWVSSFVRPVFDGLGNVVSRSGGWRTLQERVLAQLEVEESKARFAAVFESHDAIMLIIEPVDGAIVDVNSSAAEFYGYSRDQMRVMNIADINRLPASEIEALRDRAATRGLKAFVMPHRLADGSIRSVEVHSSPIDDGQRTRLFSIVRDVTAAVANREALAASQDRYRQLAENATDIVAQFDAAAKLLWATPSFKSILGFEPTEFLGMDAAELIHDDDLTSLDAWRVQVFSGAEVDPLELRLRTAGGDFRWMSMRTRPQGEADGSISSVIVGLRDIAEEVRAREQLARSELSFHLAMDGAPQGMAVVGLDLQFLQVNAMLCSMLGRDESWLLTHEIQDVIHPDEVAADRAGRNELLSGSSVPQSHERRWLRSDGSPLWVIHSTSLLRDENNEPKFYVSHVQDNTDAHLLQQELASRANHDPLTGLINRNQLQARLTQLSLENRAPHDAPSILFCDLDHFKVINDKYGHGHGDEVLKATAQRIAASLRPADIVARFGGDEFVVLVDHSPDEAAAVEVAERIRAAVSEPIAVGADCIITTTLSVGIVVASRDGDAHRLLRNADAALYSAKRSGRDQIAVFNGASTSRIETEIRDGLDAGQFVPWFQSLVDLKDGAIVGYEALARWVRPDGTVVSPDGFLSDAERTNLIVDLDFAILEQSLAFLHTLPESHHVAVNVSAATLASSGYTQRVIQTLTDSGTDPNLLHLEFTETSMLNASSRVRQAMSELAKLGIRWYVDDFGTGYSSISHLRDLPIAGLKLDLSFTKGLGLGDLTCDRLAQALVGLAEGLELDTVAEGIETEEQAAILIDQGWKHGQGWLYGHAEPLLHEASEL